MTSAPSTGSEQRLAERYGAPAPWRRRVAIGITVALAAVGLVWLAWAAFFHGSPEVRSELVTFEVVSSSETTARVDVRLGEDVQATCRLRALAADKTAVGEIAFTPVNGNNDVVIRTEREATAVEKLGCTTPDQPRPR
ncbi:protein of unknown function [Nocardioides exalbidus]|uniref:DUF4307 domain-containing protein n=1 Tax=Nocardioides exalbidus TaxID=402596 RepID=A0A1H4K6Q9_9ACTN|nr:DUF4307 domain-containing protein [Nocardioides exalbidus]SEB54204.1 protein of unknown function [Nocardioides exalbidus]